MDSTAIPVTQEYNIRLYFTISTTDLHYYFHQLVLAPRETVRHEAQLYCCTKAPFLPWPPQGWRKTSVYLSLQIRLRFEMNSRFRVYASNDRERDAVRYRYQIFSKRGKILLLSIKMIEQHVSALLNVKSGVKALSVLILSLDQPVELLSIRMPSRAHTCSLLSQGVLPRAKTARKRNNKEFTPFSELGKFQLIIK